GEPEVAKWAEGLREKAASN
uniref:Conantokin-Pr3 n=1 Tax=Conus parius TaxID=505247 RepID=CKP3_CONPI|nr:RecName: Full=Conantokin-Pr3; Short=Con-Pr3 [Conus parius]